MAKSKQKMSLEKLAHMVARGFEDSVSGKEFQEFCAETSGNFSETSSHFSAIENRLDAIEQNQVFIRTEIKDLRHDTYGDIADLQGRVVRLEKRTGLRK